MKSVIEVRTEADSHGTKSDYIFRCAKNVTVTREIRPLPEAKNIFTYDENNQEVRKTEMDVFVIRFPKELKKGFSNKTSYKISDTFFNQWITGDEYIELLLHFAPPSISALFELENEGLFTFTEKEYPSIHSSLVIPYYQYPVTMYERTLNVFSVVLSIPPKLIHLFKMEKMRKKRNREIMLKKEK